MLYNFLILRTPFMCAQVVAISSGGLSTREGYKDSREVKILFEETFFNQRDESYRVLCLEQPLEGGDSFTF